ncbi:histidine ABC transporter permease [Escherichia coli]|uniref:Histidine ABC transporter permease n=1 Tax=Escherichia coli TaxID=562 RepID=A0A2X3JES9_ECOLX|nr:histidine ABC transporter permease [Escherichia coli]
MLLIFYGLQIALNTVTEAMGVGQIDIDPMVAGIITLGFIYGAYFTETFRGAFMAVPKGHIEAATAFGFTRGQVFRRIMFPAMMRYALPGIGNNWQVILKSTALVSLLGLEDVVKSHPTGRQKYLGTVLFRHRLWRDLPGFHHCFQWCAAVPWSAATPWV